MKNENNRAIPLDFKLWAVFATYTLAMVAVILFGLSLGARLTWMIGAFLLGLLAGLPAARWELAAITESWEEILCGPKISLRLVYFDKEGARRRSKYFLIVAFLVPIVFLVLIFVFYWYRFLSQTSFWKSLFLLIRWNMWYWLPYIFGQAFTSTSLPRLIAASSYGMSRIPAKKVENNE